MKIIKEGKNLYEKEEEMYIQTCPVCGCVFTFLASEAEREKTPNGNWHITCPYCHHEIVIKSSELRKHKEKHKNDK